MGNNPKTAKSRKPVKAEEVRKAPDRFVAIVNDDGVIYVGRDTTQRYNRAVERLSANQAIYSRFTATREGGDIEEALDWIVERDQMAGIAVRSAGLPLKCLTRTEAEGLSKLYGMIGRRK